MKRKWRATAASAATWALAVGIMSAQAPRSYTWYAQVAAVDQTAKSIVVTAQTREAVGLYVGDYMPGDKLMLVWVPIEGESDTVLYAPQYETMDGIDEGYILPVDFVSADPDADLLTFRIPVPDSVLSSIASVQPGNWIKVTTPMQQAQDVPSLTSAEPAEKPDLKPPPPPEPEPDPSEGAPASEETGLTGTWAVSALVSGNLVDYDCTLFQQELILSGTCSGPFGEADVTGMVSDGEVAFQFSANTMVFSHVGMQEGDTLKGELTVYGVTSDFTATRK